MCPPGRVVHGNLTKVGTIDEQGVEGWTAEGIFREGLSECCGVDTVIDLTVEFELCEVRCSTREIVTKRREGRRAR